MIDRNPEFWLAMAAAAAYVFLNSKEKQIGSRLLMVASSAGFGISLAKDVSNWVGLSENISGVVITVFGYLMIDLATALISDRALVKQFIKSRMK